MRSFQTYYAFVYAEWTDGNQFKWDLNFGAQFTGNGFSLCHTIHTFCLSRHRSAALQALVRVHRHISWVILWNVSRNTGRPCNNRRPAMECISDGPENTWVYQCMFRFPILSDLCSWPLPAVDLWGVDLPATDACVWTKQTLCLNVSSEKSLLRWRVSGSECCSSSGTTSNKVLSH